MFSPVVIIGAPRSGTNMLRDILCNMPHIGTWPCDEINYIWRHGNITYPSDRIPPELATPQIVSFIQSHFHKIAHKMDLEYVVEKTCANSLRVGFVNKIIPDAKYIFIVRNGIDVVASAAKRWKAELDIAYILKKTRYVPFIDLPYYASRYFGNRLYRAFSGEKRLAFWGPRLDNMDMYLSECSLEEVCAHQWQQCVSCAEEDFSSISQEAIYHLRYEDFVNSPDFEVRRIFDFLNVSSTDDQVQQLVSNVSSKSVGRGEVDLSQDQLAKVTVIVRDTLQRHGYDIP